MKRAFLGVAVLPISIIGLLGGPPRGGHDLQDVFSQAVSGFDRTVQAQAQQEAPSSPRAVAPLTILQINDVYPTIPIDGAAGIAGIAALKLTLAAAGRTPFLVLAGDFLSPSVASSIFKGEAVLRALKAAGL